MLDRLVVGLVTTVIGEVGEDQEKEGEKGKELQSIICKLKFRFYSIPASHCLMYTNCPT